MAIDTREQAPRDRAVQRIKRRRDFHAHFLVYVLVNGFVVLIWAITGADGFFWPSKTSSTNWNVRISAADRRRS